MNNLYKKILLGMMLAIICITGTSSVVLAQQGANPANNPPPDYTLLEPLPNLTGKGPDVVTTVKFSDYVSYTFNLFIALAAAAAVFMIVFGGFQYMTTDSWKGKTEGMTKVKNALLGLLLVLGSYLLLRTIDPRLVEIPSTLVKPLSIKYTKTSNQLLDDLTKIANYRYINQDIISNVRQATEELIRLENNASSIRDEIRLATGLMDATDQEIDMECSANTGYDVETNADLASLCDELQADYTQIRETTVDMSYSQGMGLINAGIQKCYVGGGMSQQALALCQSQEIRGMALKYIERLKTYGEPGKAAEVNNYLQLSYAVSEMNNSILSNLSENPYAQMMINNAQSAITVVGTGVGAVVGGGVGGAAGFVGAQAFNGIVVNGLVNADNKAAVQKTITEIKKSYTSYSSGINNAEIKTQLTAQTNAYLKSLGVKDAELVK